MQLNYANKSYLLILLKFQICFCMSHQFQLLNLFEWEKLSAHQDVSQHFVVHVFSKVCVQ